jgi:drug/metabolite transporter (DMT)-like permease
MLWFWLSLGVAGLLSFRHSFQRELFKTIQSPVVMLWAIYAFIIPFQIPFLIGSGPVWAQLTWQFWGLAALDILLFIINGYLLMLAVTRGEYSKVSPIKSFVVIFSLLFSFILLREVPSVVGIVGVFIVFMGTYLLDSREESRGVFGPFKNILMDRPSQYMMGSALIYAFNLTLTRPGLELSSPAVWIFARSLIAFVFLSTMVALKRNTWPRFRQLITYSPWKLVIFGVSGAAVVFLRTWATDLTLVSYVAAVINLQVVIDVLIGHFIFQEKHWVKRLEGSMVMVAGAAIIIFFS